MNRQIGSLVAITCVLLTLPASVMVSIALGQRGFCEGDSWLSWSPERRDAYVGGYIEGYYGGYVHGCEEGTKEVPAQGHGVENFPVNKCVDRKWDFTKGINLSKDITMFYKRYPENRDLLIKEILVELGKGRSIRDIHEHPPFQGSKAFKN